MVSVVNAEMLCPRRQKERVLKPYSIRFTSVPPRVSSYSCCGIGASPSDDVSSLAINNRWIVFFLFFFTLGGFLLISTPSLGVYYCQQLTLSVRLSQEKLQIASFLFLAGIEQFLAVSYPWPLYKTLFFDFWFSPPPPTPKIYSPKFARNSL